MEITPINGCVLVKLTSAYEHVITPDKKYDTKTSGIVVAPSEEVIGTKQGVPWTQKSSLLGKKVFFEEYKDGTTVDIDGEKHAFIKLEDIRGYQNA